MLAFSMPLLLSTVTGVILTVTDRYVLGKMTGLNDVGTYSLGYKLANTIRFLIIIPITLLCFQFSIKLSIHQEVKDFMPLYYLLFIYHNYSSTGDGPILGYYRKDFCPE
jgi:O-antigen/teichoic acid export membrane protein